MSDESNLMPNSSAVVTDAPASSDSGVSLPVQQDGVATHVGSPVVAYDSSATVRERPSHTPRVETPAQPRKSIPREYFESAVVTFVMALFGMTFIVQAVKVPTGSMKNTIYIGDHLLVNKFVYGSSDWFKLPFLPGRDVRRGDVIVFKYPMDPQTNYVKRVIGLPGDTVEYNSQTNRVYINGKELPERRVQVKPQGGEDVKPLEQVSDEQTPAGAWYTVFYQHEDQPEFSAYESRKLYGVNEPYRVPKKGDPIPDDIKNSPELRTIYDANNDGAYDSDQYFCMGDNRDNSEDSRYWRTVPRLNIVGRAMFVYWSYNSDEGPVGPFARTRWDRTGKFIK